MPRPNAHLGLRHIALLVQRFAECQHFYVNILGLKVVWQPDADNLYLSSGTDNVALHRAPENFSAAGSQRLDHLGFFLATRLDVDVWYEYLVAQGCDIKTKPKDHRDGTRSCYVADPDGNVVQLIYYPS